MAVVVAAGLCSYAGQCCLFAFETENSLGCAEFGLDSMHRRDAALVRIASGGRRWHVTSFLQQGLLLDGSSRTVPVWSCSEKLPCGHRSCQPWVATRATQAFLAKVSPVGIQFPGPQTPSLCLSPELLRGTFFPSPMGRAPPSSTSALAYWPVAATALGRKTPSPGAPRTCEVEEDSDLLMREDEASTFRKEAWPT